jgi:hypothetical protein
MKIMLILFALFSVTAGAQEFEKHRWKDRLLVIYTSDYGNAKVQKQLELLEMAGEDLKERKVKVYVVSEDSYRFNFTKKGEPLKKGKQIGKSFEIVLIGLDGGEKFRSSEVQPVKTFNDLIDSMPMRQNELKNKNKE